MKLHRNLVTGIIRCLREIFAEGRYADKVLEYHFKTNPLWGARDRRFVAETTYDIVRWKRLLLHLSGFPEEPEEQSYWAMLAAYFIKKDIELPPWEEFKEISVERIRSVLRGEQLLSRDLRESIPVWLDESGFRELGEQWEKEIHAMNTQARAVIRTNTLKISREELRVKLHDISVETEVPAGSREALVLLGRPNVFSTNLFKEGLFEMQDTSSQEVAHFLDVQGGQRVIDACAGAGGKTLHLAALMQNRGKIIALDVEERKLMELKRRAARAGVSNVEARHIDSTKTIKRLSATADRLLLDVPCSGTGVLRRNPDAKWKLSAEYIEKIKADQHSILETYSGMLKTGGIMVYATCSIFPSENENQTGKFLAGHKDSWELLREKHFFPSGGYDGFYMAALLRKS